MQKWILLIIGILLSLSGSLFISVWSVYWLSSDWESEAIKQNTGGNTRTQKTYQLQKAVIELWYTEYQSKLFIDICKKQEKNISARYCVYWISAVWVAESNACKLDHWYNCRGVMRGWLIVEFENRPQAVEFWVGRYYQYRRSNKTPLDWIVRSRYCITDSHWDNELNCPSWQKNTARVLQHFEWKNIYQ